MRENYKVLDIFFYGDTALKVRTERPSVPIKPGQCFNVGFPGQEVNREYSIYSGADEDYLEFLIRIVPDGVLSEQFKDLCVGDRLEIDGPYGEFVLPDADVANSKFLFIATGTGIAPFHSFYRTYPSINFILVHGVRSIGDTYDSSDYPAGVYVPCISGGDGSVPMRVTDYIEKNYRYSDELIYICGNRNMIIDMYQILFNMGISGDHIITEVFF